MSNQTFSKFFIAVAILVVTSITTKSFTQTSVHANTAHVLSAGDPPPIPDPTTGGGGNH